MHWAFGNPSNGAGLPAARLEWYNSAKMRSFHIVSLCLASTLAACALADTTLTDIASVVRATHDGKTNDIPFSVEASCVQTRSDSNTFSIVLFDSNDALIVYRRPPYADEQRKLDRQIRPGDRLRVQGRVISSEESGLRLGYYYQVGILAHGQPPEPFVPTGDELSSGKADFRLVRVHGKVIDEFTDDADPRYVHLFIMHDGEPLLLNHEIEPPLYARDRKLIGADITAVGICEPSPIVSRCLIGRTLACRSNNDVSISMPKDFDLFSAPDINALYGLQPDQIAHAGWHRASGRVLAIWNGRSFMIRIDPYHLSQIELADGVPPSHGEFVEVAGIPSTDLFKVNLSRAVWRPASTLAAHVAEPAIDTTIRAIQTDQAGRPRFNNAFTGKTVRLRGRVCDYQKSDDATDRILHLEDGGFLATVNAGAVKSPQNMPLPNSVVEATGVCVMEADDWRPNVVFPKIRQFRIVLRTADDLRILANPPWWTRQRLLMVIGILLLGIGGIAIWNISLRVVSERRGRFLFAERAARFGAMQRTAERTRIAIELHDSISQSMSGAAMELETAKRGFRTAPDVGSRHLDAAMCALASCHAELRRCLWDLRSDALEEPTMDGAIRRTLLPLVKSSRLDVRFNVPRKRLSDDTAYAVIRIIRELVVNAINHGKADIVKIAGSMDGDTLQFSVRDNGSGFDPEARPGILEGHFGLQGVQDRISKLGGTLQIDSRPGAGCRVAVSMRAELRAEGSIS